MEDVYLTLTGMAVACRKRDVGPSVMRLPAGDRTETMLNNAVHSSIICDI